MSTVTDATQWFGLAITVLVTIVIPWLGYLVSNFINENMAHVKDQRVRSTVETLVKSAEQVFDKSGDRYHYVYNFAYKWFPELTHAEIDSLINAAVLSLHVDIGTSHTLPWNQGVSTPTSALPKIDTTALITELTGLVAPSLANQVTSIVNTHISSNASPVVEPPAAPAVEDAAPAPAPAP